MTKPKLLLVLGAFLGTLPAYADPVRISFVGIEDSGATSNLVISAGPNYSATNAPIHLITIINAPEDNGTYNVTGNCGGFGCLNFDTAANTITIEGAVAGLGVPSSTLLTGSFATFSFSTQVIGGQLRGFFDATGPDEKGAELLRAIGLSTSTEFAFGQTELTIGENNTITGSSVNNTQRVPDGGLTAMLLGGALIGVEALRRKIRV